MSRQIAVSTISDVLTGKKVTIDLDIGWKYLVVHIKRTNFTAAQAQHYAFKINGKIVQSLESLQNIEDINTHYNRPQVAGFTSIYYVRPELADSEDRDATGIGTADVKTCQIEFVLDGGLVDPDVEVKAEVTTNENLGWILHYETSDLPLSKVGKNVVSKMPVGNGNVNAYFIGKATNDITDMVLIRTVNGAKNNVVESSKEFLELEQVQAPMRPRVPVTADWTVLDFTVKGIPEEALQTTSIQLPGESVLSHVERIGLDITVGTAETLTVITESAGEFTGS